MKSFFATCGAFFIAATLLAACGPGSGTRVAAIPNIPAAPASAPGNSAGAGVPGAPVTSPPIITPLPSASPPSGGVTIAPTTSSAPTVAPAPTITTAPTAAAT